MNPNEPKQHGHLLQDNEVNERMGDDQLPLEICNYPLKRRMERDHQLIIIPERFHMLNSRNRNWNEVLNNCLKVQIHFIRHRQQRKVNPNDPYP